jgi:hypothetical protein
MTESTWIKCDSCPAQAKYLARGTSGELAFCAHHKNKNSETLDKWAFEMIELNKTEEAPKLTEKAV